MKTQKEAQNPPAAIPGRQRRRGGQFLWLGGGNWPKSEKQLLQVQNIRSWRHFKFVKRRRLRAAHCQNSEIRWKQEWFALLEYEERRVRQYHSQKLAQNRPRRGRGGRQQQTRDDQQRSQSIEPDETVCWQLQYGQSFHLFRIWCLPSLWEQKGSLSQKGIFWIYFKIDSEYIN